MTPRSRRPERQDNVLSSLNVAIEALNLAKEVLSITPAKAVCGSVGVILTTIRVCFLLARVARLQADTRSGFDGQPGGLRRARASLC